MQEKLYADKFNRVSCILRQYNSLYIKFDCKTFYDAFDIIQFYIKASNFTRIPHDLVMNHAEIKAFAFPEIVKWPILGTKDMQTPPPPLRSGHLYIKDAEC